MSLHVSEDNDKKGERRMKKRKIIEAYSKPEEYDNRFKGPLSNYLRKVSYKIIVNEIKELSQGKVLEIGCGTCEFLRYANGFRVGVDISKHMLFSCKRKGMEILVIGDAEKLPFKENMFDFIICIGLFEYVNLEKTIKEIQRVLKNNGKAYLRFPNKFGLYNMQIRIKNLLFRKKTIRKTRSLFEVLSLLRKTDFKILDYHSEGVVFYVPKGFLYSKLIPIWKFLERFNSKKFPIGHAISIVVMKNEHK